jgi:hypothetical protein
MTTLSVITLRGITEKKWQKVRFEYVVYIYFTKKNDRICCISFTLILFANKKQFLLRFEEFCLFIANFWRKLRFQSQERQRVVQNFLQMQSKPLTVITYVVINCECDHIDPSWTNPKLLFIPNIGI